MTEKLVVVTPQIVGEWRRLYEMEHKTTIDIAMQYKCTATTVSKYLRADGVMIRGPDHGKSDRWKYTAQRMGR